MKLNVIVPLFNEEKRIQRLVEGLNSYQAKKHMFQIKFLLIDDGSTDQTKSIVTHLIEDNSNITMLSYEKNLGKGAAILYGLKNAQSDYVGFMDADLATPLYHIDHIMCIAEETMADFIIGNRKASLKVYQNPIRNIASKFFNIIAHFPLKNLYPDTQAGFKFYSKTFLSKIIKLSHISNYAFDIEHLLIAEKTKANVISYDIHDWSNGDYSKVSLIKDGVTMTKSSLYLILNRSKYTTNLDGKKKSHHSHSDRRNFS